MSHDHLTSMITIIEDKTNYTNICSIEEADSNYQVTAIMTWKYHHGKIRTRDSSNQTELNITTQRQKIFSFTYVCQIGASVYEQPDYLHMAKQSSAV